MLETADVLVENFDPGTMERLGYGYEAVKQLNMTHLLCFERFLVGSLRNRTAMDEVVQMMGGLAYMTGFGRPHRAGSSVIDMGGGMFGVLGILSALFDRERSGRGRYLKVLFLRRQLFRASTWPASVIDEPVPPMPSRISAWSIYRTFKTKRVRPYFVGIISDKHWVAFVERLRFDWLENPNLKTNNVCMTPHLGLSPKWRLCLQIMILTRLWLDVRQRGFLCAHQSP